MGNSDVLQSAPRTTIQQALAITINDVVPSAEDLAVLAKVPASTLSEFKNNRRAINTHTLQRLINALTSEQYSYFLDVLVISNEQMQYAERSFREEGPSSEAGKRGFLSLVASYCSRCTHAEQLELLATIHQASLGNPNLRDSD